jgi:hypothetical protein
MEKFIDALKYIGFCIAAIILIGFLQISNEEEPHRVTIEGKSYIRSKEYAGNGTYQVILIPIDSTQTK